MSHTPEMKMKRSRAVIAQTANIENPWTVGDVAVYVAGPPHRRSDIGSTVTVEHIGSDPSGVPCATIRFSDGYRTAVRACAEHTNIRPVEMTR